MASTPLVAQPPAQAVPEMGKYFVQVLRFGRPERVEPIVLRDTQEQLSPRPSQMLLGTLNDFSFRVAKAIPVGIESNEACVVASWPDIDEFGSGSSTSSACEDLGHTLVELYRSLEADKANLGPDLQHVWAVLQEHLVRRK